jgi:hypothetical protein
MPGHSSIRHAQLSGFFVGLPLGSVGGTVRIPCLALCAHPPDAAEKGEPATLLLWAKGGQGCAAHALIGRTPPSVAGLRYPEVPPRAEYMEYMGANLLRNLAQPRHTHGERGCVCVCVARWLRCVWFITAPWPDTPCFLFPLPPKATTTRPYSPLDFTSRESSLVTEDHRSSSATFCPPHFCPASLVFRPKVV